jgi:hypothetical protein
MSKNFIFQAMAEKWSSVWVARNEVYKFTGGAMSAGYIANLDCRGLGPKGRIRIGRKVCYPVDQLLDWLEKRTTNL